MGNTCCHQGGQQAKDVVLMKAGVMSPRDDLPGQAEVEVERRRRANLFGVGIVFRTARDGRMVVASFLRDSSAYECGLVRDGDILVAIDSKAVDQVPSETVQIFLLGARDTWVQLRFVRQLDGKRGVPFSDANPEGGVPRKAAEDVRWASSTMRSWAPQYEQVIVDLRRQTPSNTLDEAATQAREEAVGNLKQRGGR